MNIKKIIKILMIISILSLVLMFYLINYKKESTKTNNEVTSYKDISNVSVGLTKEEIEKQIGKSINSVQKAEITISNYKSDNIYRPHQIYFDKNNNSELIIKEITDNSMTTDKMREDSGLATNILYEKKEHSSFNLYVYLNKGIAYRGHANGGLVLEIWYFKPTDIDSFIEKYAQNYQKTPFTEQTGY